jgi:hypothetical protein
MRCGPGTATVTGMAGSFDYAIQQRTERRYQRHKVESKLRLHVFVDEDSSTLVHGRACELGRGGLGAVLSTQLRPGETVYLESALLFSAYATVRYTKGFYHGLEFTMLRQNDRTRVDALCDRYADERCAAKATA